MPGGGMPDVSMELAAGYANWYNEKIDDTSSDYEKSMIQHGKFSACIFCNMFIKEIYQFMKANEDVPFDEKTPEEDLFKNLEKLCKGHSGDMAQSMPGEETPSSVERICMRVIRNHVADWLDGASAGENLDTLCQEADLCAFPRSALVKMQEMKHEIDRLRGIGKDDSEARKEFVKHSMEMSTGNLKPIQSIMTKDNSLVGSEL